MLRRPFRGLRRTTIGALVAGVALTASTGPVFAAQGRIDHVESNGQSLKVLYSLPDAGNATPDLSSLSVSYDGKPLEASATLASDAKGEAVRRTAILAMDVSNSMKNNNKFAEAKHAADVFLESAPKDLYVGIVTFANDVTVAQAPTLDRAASKSVINSLSLSLSTHLYEGVKGAVRASGTEGQRSVLVLSDGRDTTKCAGAATPKCVALSDVTRAVKDAKVQVDVVALAQSPEDKALLQQIADSGHGSVINAGDPAALSQVFANEAQTLAKQILITARTPSGAAAEGNLSVAIDAGGQTYTSAAFVNLGKTTSGPAPGPSTKLPPVTGSGVSVSRNLMLGGVAALGLGLLAIVGVLLGATGKKKDTVESRIDAYTQKGRKRAAPTQASPQGVAAQAVGIAEKALEGNRGLEAAVGDRLEAAGMALKPAEWLLLHAGIAVGAAAVGFLVSSGGFLITVLLLLVGAVVPWLYLGMKRSRRLRAFNGQLAETLQLMAGSLQAGLSIAQSIDTVVREGADPIATEFRRALVETRLGVQIEDALESVSGRMESADFRWTVMAIRIQREVGGNLAELLISVAATLRERDYLRRQVKALSAEGRFSAYILLGLPPMLILYMSLVNRSYLHPLVTTPIGWVLIGVMVFLMVIGSFSMKKIVKVDV